MEKPFATYSAVACLGHLRPYEGLPATAVCLYLTRLASLWVRRRSTLDLWLMVVLCTLLIESVVLAYLTGGTRINVAW